MYILRVYSFIMNIWLDQKKNNFVKIEKFSYEENFHKYKLKWSNNYELDFEEFVSEFSLGVLEKQLAKVKFFLEKYLKENFKNFLSIFSSRILFYEKKMVKEPVQEIRKFNVFDKPLKRFSIEANALFCY